MSSCRLSDGDETSDTSVQGLPSQPGVRRHAGTGRKDDNVDEARLLESTLRALGASSAADLLYVAFTCTYDGQLTHSYGSLTKEKLPAPKPARDPPNPLSESAPSRPASTASASTVRVPAHWREVLRVLVEEVGLHGGGLSRVFERGGGVVDVLALDPSHAFAVVQFLREDVGFSRSQLAQIIAQRPALLRNEAAVREGVALLRSICFADKDVRNTASKWPRALALDADRGERVITTLCHPQVGFRRETLRSLVRRAPWILVYDVEQDIEPSMRWILDVLMEKTKDFRELSVESIVRSAPHVLGTAPETMQKVVDYLVHTLNLDGRSLSIALRQFSPLLTCSVDGCMKIVVDFLTWELGLGPDDVARIVRSFPSILSMNVETEILPSVKFFRERGISNVGRIVSRLPPILVYDVETNLAPKLDFLENELGLSAYDILSFPGYFSYSLPNVIEPRTRFLQKMGVSLRQTGLNLALASTDEQFCARWADAPLDEYISFQRALAERRQALSEESGDMQTKRTVEGCSSEDGEADAEAEGDESAASTAPAELHGSGDLALWRGRARIGSIESSVLSTETIEQHIRDTALPPAFRPVVAPKPRRRKRRLRATDARVPWRNMDIESPSDGDPLRGT